MATLHLFVVTLKKELRIMRSYGFNTIMEIATLGFFFALLYFGAHALVGSQSNFGDTTEALILGYWIWVGLLTGFGQFTWTITTYAQQGLLEQLFMTPWQLQRVLAVEAAASFLINSAMNLILLVIFMLITGRWLHLDPLTTLALYVLTLLPGYGIGYMLAGLAMRFKNVQSLFNIVQFVVIPLQALPISVHPWLNVFPFAQGMHMLLEHARAGTLLWQFPLSQWGILIAQAAAYLALGLVVYHRLENAARERGLLAHY